MLQRNVCHNVCHSNLSPTIQDFNQHPGESPSEGTDDLRFELAQPKVPPLAPSTLKLPVPKKNGTSPSSQRAASSLSAALLGDKPY